MNKKNKQLTFTGLVVIAGLVAGALAGVVSSTITNRSLENYIQVMSEEEIILSLSQVKPEAIPGTYEEALTSVYDSFDSLAYLYNKKEISINHDQWIEPNSALGVGVVVTSDGWIIFDKKVFNNLNIENLALYINEEWHDVIEVVEDTRSDAVLVNVDVSNLNAITFGSSDLARSGENIFIVQNNEALFVSLLTNTKYYSQKDSLIAENYASFWYMQDELESSLPIFDSSGHMIGFTKGKFEATPFYHFEHFIESVLEFGEPQYSSIGAYTFNIERAINVDTELLGTDHGFIIIKPSIYSLAIVNNSPADFADLKELDIITSINQIDISSEYLLVEALSKYSIGDEITLGVIRDAEYLEVSLTLEDYNLLY